MGKVREIQGQGKVREIQGQGKVREIQGQGKVREIQGQGKVREIQGQGKVREIQGQGKVREFCARSGKFKILRKSRGNTGKFLESQGNLTFSCHTHNAAMPRTRIHYA